MAPRKAPSKRSDKSESSAVNSAQPTTSKGRGRTLAARSKANLRARDTKSSTERGATKKPKSLYSEAKVKSKNEDFFERVWEIVRCIPRGKVCTYGHIAAALGAKSSSRMVGWAMNVSHVQPWVPAHRVVNRLGDLSGKMHFDTPTLMRELLEAEGVQFDGDHVKLELHLWIPPIQGD